MGGGFGYTGPRCACGRPTIAGYPCVTCADAATRPDDPIAEAYRRRVVVRAEGLVDGEWLCVARRTHGQNYWPCTTINDEDADSCGACGEPRPSQQ